MEAVAKQGNQRSEIGGKRSGANGASGGSTLAGVKYCQADNLIFFISNDYIVICQFTISSMAWLLEIYIQDVCLSVIR